MSDNEFEEMYQKGDLVWVDPDGREWVPAHEHASLTETIENLRGHLKSKTEDATTEHYDLEKCLKRKFDLLDENASLTEKVEIEHEQVCQFIRDMYTGRFRERAKYYHELPQWIRDAIEADPIYNSPSGE